MTVMDVRGNTELRDKERPHPLQTIVNKSFPIPEPYMKESAAE